MNLKEDVYRMLKRKVYTDLPLDVIRDMDFSSEDNSIKF